MSSLAHDAGRNDFIHGDEHLIEDETADDREADYRKAIPFDDSEMAILAERLMDEPDVLEALMSISTYDAVMAGLHLRKLTETLVDKRAAELASEDQGQAQELICDFDPIRFEMRVESAKAALRR
jgi:hypothetical protein